MAADRPLVPAHPRQPHHAPRAAGRSRGRLVPDRLAVRWDAGRAEVALRGTGPSTARRRLSRSRRARPRLFDTGIKVIELLEKSKVALIYGQMTEPPGARLRV